jgi:hypothetical protein
VIPVLRRAATPTSPRPVSISSQVDGSGVLLHPAPDQYVDPYQIAFVFTALGRRKQALEWLAKAVGQRTAIIMKVDPYLDPLRADPEFHQLLAEMRLS